MIISHSHRFIFIKTKKVAGSSMQRQLVDDGLVSVPNGDYADGTPFPGGGRFYNSTYGGHVPARDVMAAEPDLWNRYFTWTIERNPWDAMVSLYHYRMAHSGVPACGFDRWLPKSIAVWHNRNEELYTTGGGDPHQLVDEVVLYEELDDGMRRIYSRMGLVWGGPAARVHTTERKGRAAVSSYYDDRLDALIRGHFSWTIARFGYECPD